MADQVGRFALTAIGYAVFGPWGALAGSFLANFLFPVEGQKGPRLNELNVQRSTVGAPIPIVYGTGLLAGNVIFSGGLVETEHEGGGGKGGPSGPTTYSYAVDVAIGICEGPINGIRRIWADADLIYDASDDETFTERWQDLVAEGASLGEILAAVRVTSSQVDFDLYLGDEDQLPDPTIEGHVGVGLTPSYRGLAYIVFPNFQLERFGNRIPNFRMEVFSSGSDIECGVYTSGHLEPWMFMVSSGVRDPRNPDNNHLYGYMEDGGTANTTLTAALADMTLVPGHPFLMSEAYGEEYRDNIYIHGWSTSTTPNEVAPAQFGGSATIADYVTVQISLNNLEIIDHDDYCADISGCADMAAFVGAPNTVRHELCGNGRFLVMAAPGTSIEDLFDGIGWESGGADPDGFCPAGLTGFDYETHKWYLHDHQMGCRRTIEPMSAWNVNWVPATGTYRVLVRYQTDGGNIVEQYPLDPCLATTDTYYNDQDYWEAAYAAALADGAMLNGTTPLPGDWVYGVDYPTTISVPYSFQANVWQAECTAVEVACVPMADIVTDICRRAGLRTDTSSQIDVSDLTTCVSGYIVGRQMSGRDALGPLRMFGLFDAVESDAVLRFIERGHALVATLTTDDLGAHENGSEPPSLVEVARTQEKDLPRRLRLHFPNFLHDHEVSEQFASRITTEAIDEVDVQLPVSMEPDTAKQLAEIMLAEAWVSRNGYRFTLDNDWLGLEPTDCVGLPVDGNLERVRIVSIDYKIGGLLQIDAIRDDDGTYVSTAVAIPSQPSGGVPGSSGGGPICDSEVVLLDIPCLTGTPPSGEAWIYGAIYGTCADFWNSAALYRSDDGGETYAQIARTDHETTVGEILDITGPATDPTLPGDSPPYDSSNSITVSLYEGTLASVSDEGIASGLNLAAIGIDGRWVIIQFKTVTLTTTDTYELTDLIWGVNGTEHLLGTTGVSDTFVLLSDSALLRIPVPSSEIGVEKLYKVVSYGQSIDAVDEIYFTTWGLCYQRLCPQSVISATVTDPPASPADGDSYLLPNDTSLSGVWSSHGGEIATWRDALDNWDYCTPVPGAVIHIQDGEDTSEGGTDVISGGDGTYTPSPWAPANAMYLTHDDERARLPNSLPLIAGDNIVFEQDSSGLIIHGSAGGFDTSDTSDIGISLDALTDVYIDSSLAPGDVLMYDTSGWHNMPAGGGDVAGPGGVSTDNAIVRWEGTGGDTLQNSATILDDSDVLTTPNASAAEIGFKGIPQRVISGNDTLVLTDAGKQIYKSSGGSSTVTIPANGSVAFPIGTCIEIINDDTETLVIAITTDTLVLSPSAATGSRTLAARGWAIIKKVTSTRWFISGAGLT